jgi:Type III restriction enzyme, res subunit
MELLVRKPDVGYLDSCLWVPKTMVNVDGTKNALTYEFFDRKQVNILTLYKETEHHLLLPREFWKPEEYNFPVIDCRPQRYPRVTIRSKVKLDHRLENGQLVPNGKTVQQEAMRALLSSRGGVLQLSCGGGKTVVALDFAARRGVPLLVILDTTELIRQWGEEIAEHLEVPDGVGLIQGKTFDWKKPVVIATYHSLASKAHLLSDEVRRWFGTIIWDEAHHIAAPTFSRTADLFYGLRLGLTATPDRDDGYHVIYNFHLGQVIYKNLHQELTPRICFVWTGIGLDLTNPQVKAAVQDCNGELHIGKIASFLGAQPSRIDFILDQVRAAITNNRKVLVLSKSVDSLVNLLAAWNNKAQALITDIPFPTAQDVEETTPPVELEEAKYAKCCAHLQICRAQIAKLDPTKDSATLTGLHVKKAQYEQMLDAHRVFKKCEASWNKARTQYLNDLLEQPSDAGLMIYKVKPSRRAAMLRDKKVTFAVMKYGREGLNERALDTAIVIEPLSSANALQQLMGRLLRKKNGKQGPVVVFIEDDIGPFIGMCKKLRNHLSSWPADQDGPLAYENIGHTGRRQEATWSTK